MTSIPRLPLDDILPLIFEHLEDDYGTLYQCSIVNHAFNKSASAILYHQIIFAPPLIQGLLLSGSKEEARTRSNFLAPSILAQHSTQIRQLWIAGYLHGRGLGNSLSEKLRGIPQWTNLTTVVLQPTECRQGQFTEALRHLGNCSKLRHLAVNSALMDEAGASALVKILGLSTLTLLDPTRAILDVLLSWLSSLIPTLISFNLKGNCGSVTPGVLRSLVPFLSSIRGFSLGLSYSLEDAHTLDFLSHLSLLQTLTLRYYWQIKQPNFILRCPRLQYITVIHNETATRRAALHLCKWVKRIISGSRIKTLELVSDSAWDIGGPNVSYDSLFHHIATRHATSLRAIRAEYAFIGMKALEQLCSNCSQLEELVVSVSVDTLLALPRLSRSNSRLRSITLRVCNTKQKRLLRLFTDDDAQRFFLEGSPALRFLKVNKRKWGGSWKTVGPSKVEFQVEAIKPKPELWCFIDED